MHGTWSKCVLTKPVLLPENTPMRIMVSISCSVGAVSFIELLRIFASYMVKLVLKYCVQKKSY